MPFLLGKFKRFVWPKIQKNIEINKIPSSDEILFLDNEETVTVNWEIMQNANTSALMISITIEGIPDKNDSRSGKLDIQLSLPNSNNCSIRSEDVTVTNWDEVFDTEYDTLPDYIRDSWNKE